MRQVTDGNVMKKSPDAFRTISEVAEWLDVPTHVLRFWESRFAQVKPVKRAGGRRYYRPSDMELIGGIKRLLHDEGMTIRGVQKLLREEGAKHVSSFSQPLGLEDDGDLIEGESVPVPEAAEGESDVIALLREAADGQPDETEDTPGEVVSFGSVRRDEPELPLAPAEGAPETSAEAEPTPTFRHAASAEPSAEETKDDGGAEEDAPEAEAPALRIPETPDVPLTDAPDDAEEHPARPGAVARLITRDPARPMPGDVRIEEVVAALRAVRDRDLG